MEADGGGEQSLEDRRWKSTTDRAHSGLEGAPRCPAAFTEPVEADGGGEQSLEDRRWKGTTDRAHSGLEGAPGCMAGFILERSRNKRGRGRFRRILD